jgi:hypothetical protein
VERVLFVPRILGKASETSKTRARKAYRVIQAEEILAAMR